MNYSADLSKMTSADRKALFASYKTRQITNTHDEYHNYLDSRLAFARILQDDKLTRDFSMYAAGLEPFSKTNVESFAFAAAFAYGIGKAIIDYDPNNTDITKQWVAAVGEALAPALPATSQLPTNEARKKFVRIVKTLLSNATASTHAGINNLNVLENYWPEIDLSHPPERYNPIGDESWKHVQLTPEEAAVILSLLGRHIANNRPNLDVEMLLTTTIAVVKKGSSTNDFIVKIKKGLNDEMNINVNIDPAYIQAVSAAYSGRITSSIAKKVIEDWLNWTPEPKLRLRLTFQQAKDEGLTGFMTVRDAILKVPTFPWGRLASIPGYQGQMNAFCVARDLIGNDRYYGYNRDIGKAGIRNYHDLATACKIILVRAVGEAPLANARCWKSNIASQDQVQRLIDKYLDRDIEDGADNEFINKFLACAMSPLGDDDDDPNGGASGSGPHPPRDYPPKPNDSHHTSWGAIPKTFPAKTDTGFDTDPEKRDLGEIGSPHGSSHTPHSSRSVSPQRGESGVASGKKGF